MDETKNRSEASRVAARLALCLLAAPVVILLAANQASAQSAAGRVAVSVVVTRSCSVETPDGVQLPATPATPATPAQGGTRKVTIRCGRDIVIYPLQPGVGPNPVKTPGSAIVGTADGRAVSIQF